MFEIIMTFPFPFIPLKYLEGKQNVTKIPQELHLLWFEQFNIFVLCSRFRYIFTLYLMSDCYLGLDQQYDIYLNVTQASISTQVTTEVSDAFADLAVK